MDIFEFIPYNDRIHYENLILLVTAMVYLWFWITVWTDFRKRSRTFIEYYMRFFLILPFWLFFIIENVETALPIHFNTILKETVDKEFIINNNVDQTTFYTLYGHNKQTKMWEYIYENNSYFFFDFIKIEPNIKVRLNYKIDSTKFDKIMLKYYPENKSSDVDLGIVLNISSVSTEVFSRLINDEILADIDYDYEYQWRKMVLFLLALFALWYHQFVIIQKRKRRAYLPVRILLSLYFLFVCFNMASTIFIKDLFGI